MTIKLSLTLAAALSLSLAGNAFAGPAEDIIAKEKCGSCHTATTIKKGLFWVSVVQKYKGDVGAEAKLVEMLKTGGPDDHKKIVASDADLHAVVKKVLVTK